MRAHAEHLRLPLLAAIAGLISCIVRAGVEWPVVAHTHESLAEAADRKVLQARQHRLDAERRETRPG